MKAKNLSKHMSLGTLVVGEDELRKLVGYIVETLAKSSEFPGAVVRQGDTRVFFYAEEIRKATTSEAAAFLDQYDAAVVEVVAPAPEPDAPIVEFYVRMGSDGMGRVRYVEGGSVVSGFPLTLDGLAGCAHDQRVREVAPERGDFVLCRATNNQILSGIYCDKDTVYACPEGAYMRAVDPVYGTVIVLTKRPVLS